MAVFLGLLVAAAYGAGDFLGGSASKRNPAASVVLASQATGLLLLLVGLLAARPDLAPGRDFVLGAASGAVGVVGVVLLYRGLAEGVMGVVAPITGVSAGVLPVAWGLLSGERPSAMSLVGVVAALAAVALVAGGEGGVDGGGGSRRGVVLALSAGACFGGVFILLAESSGDAGFWPLLSARGVSVGLLLVAAVAGRVATRTEPGSWAAIAGSGVLDVTANALFLLAAREGLLSLVAVLSSLYPAGTALLGRVFLGERLQRPQLAGVGLALAGVALIAAG